MLDARKSAILRKVVATHIESGQPVGSAHVVRDPAIDVSPATVRADMATLEREGYLTHPHTSAGRVPTDLGYRFFVDHLERESTLDPAREEQVADFFARAHGELERMLRDTSRLLSQLTDHAAVVVAPAREALTVRSVLLTLLEPGVALLVVVLSNGGVDKHVVTLGDDTPDAVIGAANAVLNRHLVGGNLTGIGPPPHGAARLVDEVVARCWGVLDSAGVPATDTNDIYVGGTARMAEHFAAVDTVREVLSILEQSFVVVSLLSDIMVKGQTVSIGTENGVASLAECSLVVAPYEVNDEVVGTIGVLGPTRMNYAQTLAAVAVVSDQLGRQLTRG